MVLIALLYVTSIVCCNWLLHEEKVIFMNINEQLVTHNQPKSCDLGLNFMREQLTFWNFLRW